MVAHAQAANGDDIIVHDATGAALVGIPNLPCLALLPLGRGTLAGPVLRLSIDFIRLSIGAKHPKVAGPRVKVQVQRLGRSTDLNGRNVLSVGAIIRPGSSNDAARVLAAGVLGVDLTVPVVFVSLVISRLITAAKVTQFVQNVTSLAAVLEVYAELGIALRWGCQSSSGSRHEKERIKHDGAVFKVGEG